METKICKKCGIEKPLHNFPGRKYKLANGETHYYRFHTCSNCRNIKAYKENPAYRDRVVKYGKWHSKERTRKITKSYIIKLLRLEFKTVTSQDYNNPIILALKKENVSLKRSLGLVSWKYGGNF